MFKRQLDKIDYGILELLQKDCRIPHKTIARELNISLTPIHIRIKRLEEEGYIRRCVALIDPKKIGMSLTAHILVQIKPHSEESLIAFAKEVIKFEEVLECSNVTGKFDFLLKIIVKDMDAYNELIIHNLSKLPTIDHMESLFVISQPKFETGISIRCH